jgi:hypothetical protein
MPNDKLFMNMALSISVLDMCTVMCTTPLTLEAVPQVWVTSSHGPAGVPLMYLSYDTCPACYCTHDRGFFN